MGGGHNSPVSTVLDAGKQQQPNEKPAANESWQHHTISLSDTTDCSSNISPSSSSYSTFSDTSPVLQPSTLDLTNRTTSPPISYVPNSKALVNVDLCSSPARTPAHHQNKDQYSSVKAYMECLSPQSLKCVLVGDSGVGKTSLLTNYTTETFVKQHSPTIYDKFITSLSVNGRRISMTLCDTSGSDDFGHLRPLCYPQADVALICFSVVDSKSLDNAKTKWIREIKRYCPGIPIVLVGTHTDKRDTGTILRDFRTASKRYISKIEGHRVASSIKACAYVECSSRYHPDVKAVFDEAISTALELGLTQSDAPNKQCIPLQQMCTVL